MKKIIILVAALLMSTNVFASKARLIALGEDETGSYTVDDARNIFNNVANIHRFKDQLWLELGGNGAAGTVLDGTVSPIAQGGFVRAAGNYVYGVYLNNESNTAKLLRMSAWTAAGGQVNSVDNNVDVFFGGSTSSMDWAVNALFYGNKDASTRRKDKGAAIRLGAIMGNIDVAANISVANEARDSDGGTSLSEIKYDGKSGYHVNASYKCDKTNLRPFITYKSGTWDAINNAVKTAGKFSEIQVGTGHRLEVSKDSAIISRLSYFKEAVELKFASGTLEGDIMKVPLVVGFETKANSWLTWRGSVSHNLIGNRETKNITSASLHSTASAVYKARYTGSAASAADVNGSITNGTNINAGATLNLGRVEVDGLVGTGGTTGVISNTGKSGVLDLDRLMARVAMTYSF